MGNSTNTQNNLLIDVWVSFRALPLWVQVWVVLILMPINLASLFFLDEPMGIWIAFLANIGMLLNLPVIYMDRGVSKLMSIPHLLPWTILVGLLLFSRPETTGHYGVYLWTLLFTDLISLIFDYPDAVKWVKGDRAIAGK